MWKRTLWLCLVLLLPLLTPAAPLEPLGRFVVSLRSGYHAVDSTLPSLKAEISQPQPRPQPVLQTQPTERIVPVTHVNSLKAALPAPDSRVNVSDVFWMTTVMAAACGLGAIPFFFIDKLSKGWAAMANAVACGVMIAASFDLLHEAEGYGTAPLILGLVTGCLFIKFMQDWLEQYEDVKFQDLRGADAHKILLFVGIMAAHAVGEGSGVGVSFCGRRGWAHGLLVTLAIGIHNIPEGLAVATVLVSRGTTPRKALEWTLLCALPQPLFAVPSYIFVDSFRALLPASMGFAAGCMLWIVVAELLPDALADMPAGSVASAVTLSATVLEGMRSMLAAIEQPNGSLATTLSGDVATILPAAAASAIAVTAAAVVATAAPLRTSKSGQGRAACAAGVLTVAGVWTLAVQLAGGSRAQGALATLALAGVGAALVGGMFQHQAQMLRESMRPDRNGFDVESGVEGANSDASWDVVSTATGSPTHLPGSFPAISASQQPLPPAALPCLKDKPVRGISGLGGTHATLSPIAAVMCLLALLGLAVCQGWRFAYMTAAHPEARFTARLLVSLLWALPPAVAAAGLAPQLAVSGFWRTFAFALTPGITMAVTAFFSMLCYPVGVSMPAEVPFDPNDWMSKASSVVAGGALAAALWATLPQACRTHERAAVNGATLGAAVAVGALVILRQACDATALCSVPML
eukprot:jgi/Ulvmu1/6322/UM029_0030.1